jgi:hypothetical protein
MSFVVRYVVMNWGTYDYHTSSQLITQPHVASLASSLFWCPNLIASAALLGDVRISHLTVTIWSKSVRYLSVGESTAISSASPKP